MNRMQLADKELLRSLTMQRSGETKLGECLQTLVSADELPLSNCKFVLLGIPEDVGVKANFGISGTRSAWQPVLSALVNMQSTDKFRGDEMLVLGQLDFQHELDLALKLDPNKEVDLRQLRKLVEIIDEHVLWAVKLILNAGKIPIIIGGGHNNSYPILKALSQQFDRPVNTINIDAHSDFRTLEGRHSGNGFSYAFKEGYLGKYCIVGLQENYNSQSVINELRVLKSKIRFCFFEDFVRQNNSHDRAFQDAMNFTEGICGLEIDMDSMAGVLSSAMSKTGFSVNEVRDMIAQTTLRQFFYLHIAEGAIKLEDGREDLLTGKLIALLLSDFVKAQL